LALAVVAAGGALWLQAEGDAEDGEASTESAASSGTIDRLPVQTARVRRRQLDRTQVLYGTTRAVDRARIGFTVGGRLVKLAAKVGAEVDSGAELARLDRAPFVHARDAAAAQVQRLRAKEREVAQSRARTERLRDAGVATEEQQEKATTGLAEVRAQRRAAEAELAERRRQLREAVLRAPFPGTVVTTFRDVGEMTSAGGPVVELIGAGAVEVELQLPEAIAFDVKAGEAVEVRRSSGAAPPIEGRIRSVAGRAAGPGRLFPMVVDLPDGSGMVPGRSVEARVRTTAAGVPVVPIGAVMDPSGQRPFVYRVREGHAERVDLQVGRLAGDDVEIRQGLSPGDEVVVEGAGALIDGDPVRVLNAPETPPGSEARKPSEPP
jgi:membrane fusion protein (multidrug efflux system)